VYIFKRPILKISVYMHKTHTLIFPETYTFEFSRIFGVSIHICLCVRINAYFFIYVCAVLVCMSHMLYFCLHVVIDMWKMQISRLQWLFSDIIAQQIMTISSHIAIKIIMVIQLYSTFKYLSFHNRLFPISSLWGVKRLAYWLYGHTLHLFILTHLY